MTFGQFKKLFSLRDNHKKYRVRKKNKNRIERLEDKWWTQSAMSIKWDYYLLVVDGKEPYLDYVCKDKGRKIYDKWR